MTSPKTPLQTRIEAAGVVAGGIVGAAVMFWAVTAQDSVQVAVGSIMLSPLFPLLGGAAGEWVYHAARNDRP